MHRTSVEYRSGLSLHFTIAATTIEVFINDTTFQIRCHIVARCQREGSKLDVETSASNTCGPGKELVIDISGHTNTLLTKRFSNSIGGKTIEILATVFSICKIVSPTTPIGRLTIIVLFSGIGRTAIASTEILSKDAPFSIGRNRLS